MEPKKFELSELVDKMIGTYKAYGESGVDHESIKNLTEVEFLLNHILQKLVYNAQDRNSYEGSVADIGNRSYDILMECEEYIKEVQEDNIVKDLGNIKEDKFKDESQKEFMDRMGIPTKGIYGM